jgi:hypothetical protein
MSESNTNTTTNTNILAVIRAVQEDLRDSFVTTDIADTGKYRFKYVSLPELLSIVTPLLHAQGCVAYATCAAVGGVDVITVTIAPVEKNHAMLSSSATLHTTANFQQTGAQFTYLYRRLLMGLLGIHPEDDESEMANASTAPVAPAPPWMQNTQQQAPQYAQQQAPQQQRPPAPQPAPQPPAAQPPNAMPRFQYAPPQQ